MCQMLRERRPAILIETSCAIAAVGFPTGVREDRRNEEELLTVWPWGNGSDHRAEEGGYRHGNRHLIELRRVVKTYRSAAGTFTALKGIDLAVDHGEFVAVVGKSGSGKSTAINMLAGIDRPTSGEILVGDTAVHTLSEGQMAVWRGRNLGVIFQFFQLLPTLTIVENVMLPMDFCGTLPSRERRPRAMHLLEQMEMVEHAHKLPAAVSGGQQQRAAIARALANDPPILVADEPTGNLDSKTAASVFELFERLVDQGKTILMVTHDIDLAQRVSRTVTLADGEIVDEVRRARSLAPTGGGPDRGTSAIQGLHGRSPVPKDHRHGPA